MGQANKDSCTTEAEPRKLGQARQKQAKINIERTSTIELLILKSQKSIGLLVYLSYEYITIRTFATYETARLRVLILRLAFALTSGSQIATEEATFGEQLRCWPATGPAALLN